MEPHEFFLTLILFIVCLPLLFTAPMTIGWTIVASRRWFQLRLVTVWSYALMFGLAMWVLAPWLTLSAALFCSNQLNLPSNPVFYLVGLVGFWGVGMISFFLALSQIFLLLGRRLEIAAPPAGEYHP